MNIEHKLTHLSDAKLQLYRRNILDYGALLFRVTNALIQMTKEFDRRASGQTQKFKQQRRKQK